MNLLMHSSRVNFSNNFGIKAEISPLRESKVRCKSAFSKLQTLKNKKQNMQADKIFSSVNFVFDRKNSMERSKGT